MSIWIVDGVYNSVSNYILVGKDLRPRGSTYLDVPSSNTLMNLIQTKYIYFLSPRSRLCRWPGYREA